MTVYTIGSDETLKGDSFGGLVVVGAFFDKELDLVDSKRMTDDRIRVVAQELLLNYSDNFVVKNLSAKEYNDRLEHMKLTPLLNALHTEVGIQLKKKFGFNHAHLVDQYPGCIAGDESVEKAEDQCVAVAAASIVARYYGLLQFDEMSKQLGFIVPKGSTHVAEAFEKLKSMDVNYGEFVKLSFKNVQKALL